MSLRRALVLRRAAAQRVTVGLRRAVTLRWTVSLWRAVGGGFEETLGDICRGCRVRILLTAMQAPTPETLPFTCLKGRQKQRLTRATAGAPALSGVGLEAQ